MKIEEPALSINGKDSNTALVLPATQTLHDIILGARSLLRLAEGLAPHATINIPLYEPRILHVDLNAPWPEGTADILEEVLPGRTRETSLCVMDTTSAGVRFKYFVSALKPYAVETHTLRWHSLLPRLQKAVARGLLAAEQPSSEEAVA